MGDQELLNTLNEIYDLLKREKLEEEGVVICRSELEQLNTLFKNARFSPNEDNASFWKMFAEKLSQMVVKINQEEQRLGYKTEPQPPLFSPITLLWMKNFSQKKELSITLQKMLDVVYVERPEVERELTSKQSVPTI